VKSTIALFVSVLALSVSVAALLRPHTHPAPVPNAAPPVVGIPPGWDQGLGDLPKYPDAWFPSAWDSADR